jgi:GNAT superfamily N-acetyltransferase
MDGKAMLGFAHYILHPTTGALRDAAYLQDVFVDPAQRGQGIGKALVEAVITRGKAEKWARLYWLAERQNAAAQALYKKIAPPIDFTLHVLPL